MSHHSLGTALAECQLLALSVSTDTSVGDLGFSIGLWGVREGSRKGCAVWLRAQKGPSPAASPKERGGEAARGLTQEGVQLSKSSEQCEKQHGSGRSAESTAQADDR